MSTRTRFRPSTASTRAPPTEIQSRAREYLDRIEAEHDARRKELGVADELREIPGMTTAMMVKLGEDGVKTVEDFAGYAVDDLVGWKERKDGETKFYPGVLEEFDVSRADAENMVMAARLQAGWITEEDLARGEEEEDAEASGSGRGLTGRARGSIPEPVLNEAMNDRTCIVTRQSGEPEGLLRFVAGPDGAVVPDSSAIFPAVAAGSPPIAPHVDQAVKRKLFARALKAEVGVPADLGDDGRPAAGAGRARRAGSGPQGGRGRAGRGQGRGGRARRQGRWRASCLRGGRRRRAQDRPGAACGRPCGRPRHSGLQTLFAGRIGFGIGGHKCDTCCRDPRRRGQGGAEARGRARPIPGRNPGITGTRLRPFATTRPQRIRNE